MQLQTVPLRKYSALLDFQRLTRVPTAHSVPLIPARIVGATEIVGVMWSVDETVAGMVKRAFQIGVAVKMNNLDYPHIL